MRRLLATLAVLLTCVVTLEAATYIKFEAVTVAATAVGFTASNINNTTGAHLAATDAVCRLETAEIRYSIDGTTTVTSGSGGGFLLEVGDVIVLTGNDVLNAFRAIRTGATSGVLNCTYSRP